MNLSFSFRLTHSLNKNNIFFNLFDFFYVFCRSAQSAVVNLEPQTTSSLIHGNNKQRLYKYMVEKMKKLDTEKIYRT